MWLESAPGQGSTFYFNLPLQRGIHSPNPPPAPLHMVSDGTSAVQQASLRVLLVEDNAINQLLAKSILNNLGHRVETARDGREALDLFAAHPWDLVLMDIHMPVMSGLDATRYIRQQEAPGRHTPIIAITAGAMEADRAACLAAGMDDYIAKPYKPQVLQELLERVAQQRTEATH